MKIDDALYNQILQEFDAGYINIQRHPTLPLRIFNYSKSTQFDWRWNEATSICRGLILDDQNNIIARPFEKFFTYEQCKDMNIQIPNESFRVFEKFDGSMVSFSVYNNQIILATRGSFCSDQAIMAYDILDDYPNEADWFKEMCKADGYTFLFEIIGPSNKIVVPYDKNDLVLIACIDKNGKDVDIENFWFNWPKKAKRYKQFESESFQMMKDIDSYGEEGFVILFENGFRMKIKFENYLELHKMFCGLSNRMIWEKLLSGIPAEKIVSDSPDELYDWTKKVVSDLQQQYMKIYCEAITVFNKIENIEDRKLYAQFVLQNHKELSGILFSLYDNKDISNIIWKMIRPKEIEKFNNL